MVYFLLFPFSERKNLLGEEGMREYQRLKPGALYLLQVIPYNGKKGFKRCYMVVLINQTPSAMFLSLLDV